MPYKNGSPSRDAAVGADDGEGPAVPATTCGWSDGKAN
jgi:hypothetical protein